MNAAWGEYMNVSLDALATDTAKLLTPTSVAVQVSCGWSLPTGALL